MASRAIDKLRPGFWALADQGVVSLGCFLTNIVLARSLAPAQYGIWVLLFAVLVFLYGLHGPLVTYPLSIGSINTDSTRRVDGASASMLTVVLSLPFAIVVSVAAMWLHRTDVIPSAIAAMVLWYLQETARRELMALLRHRAAVLGDAVSYLGQAVTLYVLSRSGHLSLQMAFGTLAATSAIAGIIQFVQLGPISLSLRDACDWWRRSFRLSKWMVLANLSSALIAQLVLWFLHLRSAGDVANYQAAANLAGATNPVMFGVGNLLLPAVAQARQQGAVSNLVRMTLGYVAQGALFLLPYFAILIVFPRVVLSFAYGASSPYANLEVALRVYVVAAAFMYVSHLFGGSLCAVRRTDAAFWAQFSGIPITIVAGLPLAMVYGASGACAALLAVYLSRTVVCGWLVWKSQQASGRDYSGSNHSNPVADVIASASSGAITRQ